MNDIFQTVSCLNLSILKGEVQLIHLFKNDLEKFFAEKNLVSNFMDGTALLGGMAQQIFQAVLYFRFRSIYIRVWCNFSSPPTSRIHFDIFN